MSKRDHVHVVRRAVFARLDVFDKAAIEPLKSVAEAEAAEFGTVAKQSVEDQTALHAEREALPSKGGNTCEWLKAGITTYGFGSGMLHAKHLS